MSQDKSKHDPTRGEQPVQPSRMRRRTSKPGLSYKTKIIEERIVAAQRAGVFDSLPGKGKPLDLEDLSQVPEDLRVGYHLLRNANMLPPELELKKQILSLQDLLAVTGDKPKQQVIIKEIRQKLIHVDVLHRRSFGQRDVGYYGKKLIDKLRRR
jgi:hypothetical protein